MKIRKIIKAIVKLVILLLALALLALAGSYGVVWILGISWQTSGYRGLSERSLDLSHIQDRRITLSDLDAFSDHTVYVYDRCLEVAREVASGQRTSTAFDLDVEAMTGKLSFTPQECGLDRFTRDNMREAAAEILDFSPTLFESFIECENPWDMFWFDYLEGIETGIFRLKISREGNLILPSTIRIKIHVCQDYMKAGHAYEVDPEKTGIAFEARDRALQVVEEAKTLSDIDKLLYYCDAVCERNVYRHDDKKAYGNTSQLVYIFDDDPDTHAICSGYSKAFKFLCDQTDFDANIFCYTVNGYKNGGAHMWNIVHMDDNQYYLACITTCDNNPIPGRRARFLEGADRGNREEGYTFEGEEIEGEGESRQLPEATFTYRNLVSYIWADSILNLSMEDYEY